MRRAYPASAYAPDPPPSYWAASAPDATRWRTPLESDLKVETAVIGAGYTGLGAALTLAERGEEVAVFDAAYPGWGASGRNGGFVCVGGTGQGYDDMIRDHGQPLTRAFVDHQKASVDHVAALLDAHRIDADRHSDGEWELAHSAKTFERGKDYAALEGRLGLEMTEFSKAELAEQGLSGPFIHGGWRRRPGFAVNPLKYANGLANAAQVAGAQIYSHTPVHGVATAPGGFRLHAGGFTVRAKRLVVAVNGYGADGWVPGLDGRILPVMSSIIVTRPLTDDERAAAGWTSDQAVYDTRAKVHYFRMLPEGRMMFGTRGGSSLHPWMLKNLQRRHRKDLTAMFPAWTDVEITHEWNGLLALTWGRTMHIGPLDGWANGWTAFGFHGNGVAMGTYAGKLVAEMALRDRRPQDLPPQMAAPLRRFPLPWARMAYIKGYYLWWDMKERLNG